MCWGSNRAGQLGTKSDTACAKGDVAACELVPVLVEGLTDVAELSAGDYFTCARKRSGAVFCWGIDQIGELGEVATETCEPPLVPIGRGQSPCSRSPLRVRGIDDAVRIASGSHHSCAVLATGRVVCWGSDLLVELGVPAPEKCPPNGAVGYACSSRPIDVGLADVVDVAVSGIFHPLGGGYSCAETRARDVHCWGARGDFVPGVPGLAAGAPPFIRKIAFSD